MSCRIETPTYAKQVAPDFPIQVHEENDTVTVQAGVTQRILLDYLAAHTCACRFCRAVINADMLAVLEQHLFSGYLCALLSCLCKHYKNHCSAQRGVELEMLKPRFLYSRSCRGI